MRLNSISDMYLAVALFIKEVLAIGSFEELDSLDDRAFYDVEDGGYGYPCFPDIHVYEITTYKCGCSERKGFSLGDKIHRIDEVVMGTFVYDNRDPRIEIHHMMDEACIECKASIAARQNRPDETIQQMSFSHGLAAFTRDKSTSAIKANFQGIFNNMFESNKWEICCAKEDQRIGKCGIAVKGDVIIASNIDLCSRRNKNGMRIFAANRAKHLITSVDQINEKKWSHMEFILTVSEIQYIWIKDNCEDRDELIEYFRSQGFDVKIVPETFKKAA